MEKGPANRPLSARSALRDGYCCGAGLLGCGWVGFMALLSCPGCAGAGSVAGGVVLWVVVLSGPVPLSLHAAMPNSATADREARISFLMTVSLKLLRN